MKKNVEPLPDDFSSFLRPCKMPLSRNKPFFYGPMAAFKKIRMNVRKPSDTSKSPSLSTWLLEWFSQIAEEVEKRQLAAMPVAVA
jgi:hypothetical protein